MSQNESCPRILVSHRAVADENLYNVRSIFAGFKILELQLSSWALVARTNFNHEPPFYYRFIKCRAGYGASSVRQFADLCPEFSFLMRLIPGLTFADSNGPWGVDMVVSNRRDLILLQSAIPDRTSLRR